MEGVRTSWRKLSRSWTLTQSQSAFSYASRPCFVGPRLPVSPLRDREYRRRLFDDADDADAAEG